MGTTELTADEISLYDRQIRLWGLEAQVNLRNSKILVINLTGVGVEIVKNLMLGGAGTITLMDKSVLKEQDLNSNFFVSKEHVGELKVEAAADKIREMNPRVRFESDSRNWEDIEAEDYKPYHAIVATGLNSRQIEKINKISRELKIPLFACSTHGMYGFIFNDLIQCSNWIKLERSENRKIGEYDLTSTILDIKDITENDKELQNVLVENRYREWTELSSKYLNQQYPTDKKKLKKINPVLIAMLGLLELPEIYLHRDIEAVNIDKGDLEAEMDKVMGKLELPRSIAMEGADLDRFIRHAYCEYQPTNSIIGGVVSQDIINTLVHKELPVNNVSILDGFNCEMPIYKM